MVTRWVGPVALAFDLAVGRRHLPIVVESVDLEDLRIPDRRNQASNHSRSLAHLLGLLSSLLQCMSDHGPARFNADRTVGIGARALNADTRIDNLLEHAPVNDAAVVQPHELAVRD